MCANSDFLYLDGYERIAKSVMVKLLGNLKDGGEDMAGCKVPHSSAEARILKRCGFMRCPKFVEPQSFRFICRVLSEQDRSLDPALDLRNWFFTMGDYDVV